MALEEVEILPLCRLIKPETLVNYHRLGFKLILLGSDRTTPTEPWGDKPFAEPWSNQEFQYHIYDKLFNNAHNDQQRYGALATCFGLSHITDAQGRHLFLNSIDIDSDEVYYALDDIPDGKGNRFSLIDWARENTFCTRTRKSTGYHLYWLSHHAYPPIHTKMLANPAVGNFEIKTDSGSMTTLPPSPHRTHRTFQYYNIGREDQILLDDKFYDNLLNRLHIYLKPQIVHNPVYKRHIRKVLVPKPPKEEQQEPIVIFNGNGGHHNSILPRITEPIVLSDKGIDGYVKWLSPYYIETRRHEFALVVSGFLHKSKISYSSAQEIFEKIAASDSERRNRLDTLKRTYKKPREVVCGSKRQLKEFLESVRQQKKIASGRIAAA